MLSLNELSTGRLCDAKAMSLLIPASKYQYHTLIVSPGEGKLVALVLESDREYTAFDCSTNTAWRGMLVHPVSIEVDETSIFDLDRFDPPLGSLSRKGTTLSVAARVAQGPHFLKRVDLITDLPTGSEEVEVGFTSWSIFVGRGPDKRLLFSVNRPKPTND
jgi:hypothetical protein